MCAGMKDALLILIRFGRLVKRTNIVEAGSNPFGFKKKMKRATAVTQKDTKEPKETKPKINEEVGDDTKIEGTDLLKEAHLDAKLNVWPKKVPKGAVMSMWRNPQYVIIPTEHS